MKEIWLKYTDDYGEIRRVSASAEIFTVGRHPENDLCIPDTRLSREHLRIEHYNDAFYVSDSRSSNGTTVNGARLTEAVIMRDGDELNLGGAVVLRVEIEKEASSLDFAAAGNTFAAEQNAFSPPNDASTPVSINNQSASAASSNPIPTAFFWLAPVFGLVILIFVGGFFFLLGGNKKKEVALQNDDVYAPSPRGKSTKNDDPANFETPTPKKSGTNGNSNNGDSPTDSNDSLSNTKFSADAEKVEQNATAFLRRIAQNDPTAFLTGKQAEIVSARIASLKGSSALAENLQAVKKNAAQFESLATSKNLKAQFLAVAALAKIGNNRGDPLAVARTMLPFLNDLKVTLDNKLANDNLLIIAAYERGAAGKPRSLQSALEALSKTTQNVSPREIRTIWFLREKDKLTEAEFNFAVQFLAIGAITQNPKEFNVNAEAVAFN